MHEVLTMQICPDFEQGEIYDPEEFHAFAPSEKPYSFTPELNEIWAMGYDGRHSTACVIDDGCELTHENFTDKNGKSRIVYDESMVRGESSSTGGSHGTHTAGTMAGRFTGVAPACFVEIYKGLNARGSGGSDDLTRCGHRIIERKKSGAIKTPIVVSNGSYGGGYYPPQEEQLEQAEAAGITNVVAAGNSGGSEGNPTCGHPGTTNFGVTVAAVDRNNRITQYSSRCKQVDIAAPGSDIISSVPGGLYRKNSGTSMACPWIAGLIILLSEWMLATGRVVYTTAAEWNRFFMANAMDAGKTGHDWEYGAGILTFKMVLQLLIEGKLRYV